MPEPITESENEAAQSPEEASRRFLAYFEASVREVVDCVYTHRFKFSATSQGQLWEVEYQACVYAQQFLESLADLDESEEPATLRSFVDAVLAEVKAKIQRRDLL